MTWLWIVLGVWVAAVVFIVAMGMAAARGDRIQARAMRQSHLGRKRVGL